MADSKISELDEATVLADTDEFVIASSGATKRVTFETLGGAVGGGLFDAYALLQDQQTAASSTMGGQFSSNGVWLKRTLNTEVFDVGGIVSLSSSQFTLQAGTYFIRGRAPAYKADRHKVKLRNVTDGSDAIIGDSSFAGTADSDASWSELTGRITIAGAKTFELQHQVQTAVENARGPGYESDMGVIEVYAQVEIWREA